MLREALAKEFDTAVDSVALFEALIERLITIAPGPMFSASQRYRNCLRLRIGRLAHELARETAPKA